MGKTKGVREVMNEMGCVKVEKIQLELGTEGVLDKETEDVVKVDMEEVVRVGTETREVVKTELQSESGRA